MKTIIFIVLASIGLAFSLSGAVGILRMPDLYSRIQCSSKTVTMGALPALVALVVGEGIDSSYASRALLVAVLLLVVNPAASHALARAAYKSGVPMWQGAVRDEVVERKEQQKAKERARRPDDGGGEG
ncbi:monovalent cation/H(+) antiporter subunit G [Actinocrinis sp.]|uniref:monovalent cation/H(+) antiporter subunit G n=1 Tax=Actinocrinis sp. TaxID=1920516 RepID=UPI002CD233D9|nr:monovalent cation/H(+) antiporter subunit G [Actinocrinis sp.]HXR72167.1 monovalent cation/H(+) antiporter subunit G [Actinocrinis sp.]